MPDAAQRLGTRGVGSPATTACGTHRLPGESSLSWALLCLPQTLRPEVWVIEAASQQVPNTASCLNLLLVSPSALAQCSCSTPDSGFFILPGLLHLVKTLGLSKAPASSQCTAAAVAPSNPTAAAALTPSGYKALCPLAPLVLFCEVLHGAGYEARQRSSEPSN